ncbi:MAG: PQQ-binding-like beta-propeller repeat protein, partial [Planctomycetota bacterium]|nr:PQQ-binding-like beta-propeller repeat protein [Planctomycetota bacterium]
RKHLKSSWASSTPCVDNHRVYAAFADKERYSVSAYDFDGELVWRRVLGPYESQHGLGASPIIFEDLLIVPNDQDGPSSVIALNRHTGRTVWSQLRKFKSGRTSYATPLVIREKNKAPQLICVSGESGISSLDPRTGHQNWATGPFPLRTVASPVYGNGLVVASCGQGGRYGVLQRAVDTSGHVVWTRERILPYVTTPIIYGDHLFEWNDEGIFGCVELASGKDVWTKRIGGNYSGSPICIDGKIYGVSEKGDVVIVAASPQFKLLGKIPLGDPCHSTPSVAGGRLYFRTFHRLMCLQAQPGDE